MGTVQTMSLFFALLTLVALVATLGGLALWLASKGSGTAARWWGLTQDHVAPHALWLAWIVALTCTLGSLYLSEIANFTPCVLCWYQRIAMYPLVVILGVAAWRRDESVGVYVLPIAVIGGLISTYHYLLERFPDDLSSGACNASAPCTQVWIWEFHFISIPLMALAGFALIALLVSVARGSDDLQMEETA